MIKVQIPETEPTKINNFEEFRISKNSNFEEFKNTILFAKNYAHKSVVQAKKFAVEPGRINFFTSRFERKSRKNSMNSEWCYSQVNYFLKSQ